MLVRKHVLREMYTPIEVPLATLGYRDFVAKDDWYHNLISTTSVLWHPKRKRVICGLTSFDTDIMYEFDPETDQFISLDYPNVSEKFEIKVHRSLALLKNGDIMGATAGLHREDQRAQAPGGRIFQYNFEKKLYNHLGIPVPPEYIQTISLDESRGLVYGVTYPAFHFFAFDINIRQTRFSHYVGSVPHMTAIDPFGCVWSTWSNRTHNLFKYDPEANDIVFFDFGLPGSTSKEGIMFPGSGPVDMAITGPDGFVYIGQCDGTLVRIDPETNTVESVGKPMESEGRIPAMAIGPDGRLYGICGYLDRCHIFAYDTSNRSFEIFGKVADTDTGVPLFIGHDMTFTDKGTLFLGETDTADRAGYLWECHL